LIIAKINFVRKNKEIEKMAEKSGMNYLFKDGRAYSIEDIQKDVRKAFAQDYVECRKKKHVTQRQLAVKTGIPQPNITRFESVGSNPSLELMVKMAAALGMKLKLVLEEDKSLKD
jgi:ribosome-binding protein aMBF1 (putative translation factor)